MSEAEVVPLAPRPHEAALGERERELRAALDLRDAGPVEFLDVLRDRTGDLGNGIFWENTGWGRIVGWVDLLCSTILPSCSASSSKINVNPTQLSEQMALSVLSRGLNFRTFCGFGRKRAANFLGYLLYYRK